MLDHGAARLLNRGTGPAAVEAGEEPAGKGSRPALPTSLRRNYIHATPILCGLGCNCNVAKPPGQRVGPRHRIAAGSKRNILALDMSWVATDDDQPLRTPPGFWVAGSICPVVEERPSSARPAV
jgi:hypothetical protein